MMEDLLDKMNFFNSTLLVLWAVAFVPYALNAKKNWLIGFSGDLLLPLEVFLYWELHLFPYNVLMGILAFPAVLAGGYLMP